MKSTWTSNISNTDGDDDFDTFNTSNCSVSKSNKTCRLQDLPKELILQIYSYGDQNGRQTLLYASICKYFQNIFNSDEIWQPILHGTFQKSKVHVHQNYRSVFLQVCHKFSANCLRSQSKVKNQINVVLFGSGGVGKSCLTVTFVQGSRSQIYDPTIVDSYQKKIEVGGEIFSLDIVDTAGPEEYSWTRDENIRHGDAFLLCFSLTDPESLEELVQIHDQICNARDHDLSKFAIVIVGCKSDLEDEYNYTKDQIEQFSTKMGCPYILTSAFNGKNVDACFELLVHQLSGCITDQEWIDLVNETLELTKMLTSDEKPGNKCIVM